jgi:hypothetical protein
MYRQVWGEVVKNTVVSNLFHSVKNFKFSSAKPRDFDGMLGTGLPLSMYTTKTPIDISAVLTFLNKDFFAFSVKDRYRLNYFICIKDFNAQTITFKIKFALFTVVSIMKGTRPVLIYFCYQTDSEVPNTSIYSAVFLASPYYNYLQSTASTTMLC